MGGGISWVLGAVASIFSGVAAPIAMFIDGIFGTSILKDVLGPVFKWLGFEDEDIYTASIQTIRIYDDDTLDATRKTLHVEYMKNNTGSLTYAKHYSKTGDAQFGKYYRYAVWDYVDHLPDASITAFAYDSNRIKAVVASYEGNPNIAVVDTSVRVPRDDEWAKWRLQESYGFNYEANSFKYTDNLWYRFTNATYQPNGNNIKINFTVIPTIKVTEVTTKDITVTPYDDTQDLVTTTTSITTTRSYELNGLLHTLDISTVENPPETSYVPKNSQSTDVIVTSEDKPDIEQSSDLTSLTVNSFSTSTTYFIIDYVIGDTGIHQFLLFDSANNSYNIGNPTAHSGIQKMYPILMLRNHTFNLNEYNAGTHELHGSNGTTDTLYRPSVINQQRYKSTKDLLEKIGVNLDQLLSKISENPSIGNVFSAFFVVGVSPSESDSIVSRYLYEMIDSIIDSYPYGEGSVAAYSCAFKEDPYNLVVSWEGGSNEVMDGKIASMMGDCTHGIRDEVWRSEIYEVVRWLDEYTYDSDDSAIPVQACIYAAYRRHLDWKGRVYKTETLVPTTRTNASFIDGLFASRYVPNDDDDDDNSYIPSSSNRFGVHHSSVVPTGDWSYNPSGTFKYPWFKTGTSTRTTADSSEVKKALFIKKQLTSNTYRDISIHGVKAIGMVYGGESGSMGHFSIGCEIPIDSPNLTFPLSVDIVARFTLMEKCALLGKAFHLVFYSAQHTHLEWYQTEAFGNFLQTIMIGISIIITIVVTIFTFGTGTWASLTLTQILTRLATMALITACTYAALELIGSLVQDPMLKAALSLAVMVAATFVSMGAMGGSFNWSTAVELGGVCVKAVDIYTKSALEQQQAKFGNLQKDYSNFMSEYENRTNALTKYDESRKGQIATMDLALLTQGNIQDMSTSSGIDESLNLSPSSFYYIATNQAAYDYDLMFTGVYDVTVHRFIANKLTLGLV